jgi:hypothetical protein
MRDLRERFDKPDLDRRRELVRTLLHVEVVLGEGSSSILSDGWWCCKRRCAG